MRHANAFDVFNHVRPPHVTVHAFDRQWPLTFDSAYEWIGAVGFDLEALSGVFPGGIADNDVEAMYRLQVGMPDAARRSLNAARSALGKGSGRDWWWSLNLIRKALQSWPYINGKLLLSGCTARTHPLPDWLDAAYMLLWSGADEQGRLKLDLELSVLPAGVAIRQTKKQIAQMAADFAAD